ncbi:DUF4062 domain-containing protein [Clostridium diolis]|uniref:DUF4062 domain-containing protein n=1 Tax=Clostridium diolis TaxID=223919 RepID=UPI0015C5B25A|nr:DUF4062 domain-containing protein [Clostridium diolis]
MAIPRIFVSSTYYDLKHARENLKRFISNYSFYPILNEFGNITYNSNEPLDKSCFNEIKSTDMLILLVGGRYGASISDENSEKVKEFYDKYTSITSQEYRTAYSENIPIYIFIEKSVNSEYYTYLKNKENKQIKYAHVDSVNIYKFIEEIRSSFSNNIIFQFERIEDIESILREQWAGLFQQYLNILRKSKNENKISDSISQLEIISSNINDMVNEIGKRSIQEDGEYETIIKEQNKKIINFYAEKIAESIRVVSDFFPLLDEDQNFEFSELFYSEVLRNEKFYNECGELEDEFALSFYAEEVIAKFNEKAKNIEINLELDYTSIYKILKMYNEKIRPLFNVIPGQESYFKGILEKKLSGISILPF